MVKNYVTAIALVAMLAAAGCGGGGGGGDGGDEASITGVCDACDSDLDCEEGLSCQGCLDGCAGVTKRCAGLADDGNQRTSCEDGSYPGGCVDVSGPWTISEDLDGECLVDGDDIPLDQSATATVSFNQNGCEVSYRVPEVNVERRGSIVGNRLRLSGPFLTVIDDSADIDLDENRAYLEGTVTGNVMSLMGEGSARGSIEGEALTCSGMSVADAFR
jgi:hypothetical protein